MPSAAQRLESCLTGDSENLPILFLGAGLSCEVGYPSWGQLVDDLISFGVEIERVNDRDAHIIRQLTTSGDYLAAGEILRTRLGRRADERIAEVFSSVPAHLGSYEYLIRLPHRGIITTNYDSCLEQAYAKHHGEAPLILEPQDLNRLGMAASSAHFLLKLHGDARNKTAILSSSDYTRIETEPGLQQLVTSLFLTHPVIFLGYGASDRDILAVLGQLTRWFGDHNTRKMALMPRTLDDANRRELEDQFGIDVTLYDATHGHGEVGSMIRRCFMARLETERQSIVRSTRDLSECLSFNALLLESHIEDRMRKDLTYLMGLPHQWGAFKGQSAKAANTAEMLLALSSSRHVLSHGVKPVAEVERLQSFLDQDRFRSTTLRETNVQTHALALLAMRQWSEANDNVAKDLESGAAWLASQCREDGWPRLPSSDEVNSVVTLASLLALTRLDHDAEEVWARFRPLLAVEMKSRSEEPLAGAVAGWALLYLRERRDRHGLDALDRELRDSALLILLEPQAHVTTTEERFHYREDSGEIGWRTWIHPVAALSVLGLVAWMGDDEVDVPLQPVGGWVAALFDLGEPSSSPNELTFPFMYRLWALSAFSQACYGAVIRKVGLFHTNGDELLLLRKRGTSLLILPGGSREDGEESQETLAREIREELSVELADNPRLLATFSAPAAFEQGVTVEIECYEGDLLTTPTPSSEIAEIVWFNMQTGDEATLSPIIRDEILPFLRAR